MNEVWLKILIDSSFLNIICETVLLRSKKTYEQIYDKKKVLV